MSRKVESHTLSNSFVEKQEIPPSYKLKDNNIITTIFEEMSSHFFSKFPYEGESTFALILLALSNCQQSRMVKFVSSAVF